MNRFIINLRSLDKAYSTRTTSDARHFSRFELEFRVSDDFLGNIGEPLEYGGNDDQDIRRSDHNSVSGDIAMITLSFPEPEILDGETLPGTRKSQGDFTMGTVRRVIYLPTEVFFKAQQAALVDGHIDH